MASAAPQIVLTLPFGDSFRCSDCYVNFTQSGKRRQTYGAYKSHNDLYKHVKKCHSGSVLVFQCSNCLSIFQLLKQAKSHYRDCNLDTRPTAITVQTNDSNRDSDQDKFTGDGLNIERPTNTQTFPPTTEKGPNDSKHTTKDSNPEQVETREPERTIDVQYSPSPPLSPNHYNEVSPLMHPSVIIVEDAADLSIISGSADTISPPPCKAYPDIQH